MTLGYKIKCRREELGLTQPELAQATKLSQSSISQIEKNIFIPRDSTLIVLSAVLKIPLSELLSMKIKQILENNPL